MKAQAQAFEAHRQSIWGLCYRMTGSAADADDLVQDTFQRALERPPADLERSLRPWLTKVAMNLSRDHLRRRQAKSYVGPWLPAPIEASAESVLASIEVQLGPDPKASTEARYDLLESVSFAFLVAMEALTPLKRAVLLLRDVFGYTGKEAAEVLDVSEANVKTTLHRARREMSAYESRGRAAPEMQMELLGRFLTCMATDDVEGLEALLAEDVRALSDGGGEFFAARVPVEGRDKVIKFYRNLTQRRGMPHWFEVHTLNGAPAVLACFPTGLAGEAERVVTRLELTEDGRIAELQTILTTRKLAGIASLFP